MKGVEEKTEAEPAGPDLGQNLSSNKASRSKSKSLSTNGHQCTRTKAWDTPLFRFFKLFEHFKLLSGCSCPFVAIGSW